MHDLHQVQMFFFFFPGSNSWGATQSSPWMVQLATKCEASSDASGKEGSLDVAQQSNAWRMTHTIDFKIKQNSFTVLRQP